MLINFRRQFGWIHSPSIGRSFQQKLDQCMRYLLTNRRTISSVVCLALPSVGRIQNCHSNFCGSNLSACNCHLLKIYRTISTKARIPLPSISRNFQHLDECICHLLTNKRNIFSVDCVVLPSIGRRLQNCCRSKNFTEAIWVHAIVIYWKYIELFLLKRAFPCHLSAEIFNIWMNAYAIYWQIKEIFSLWIALPCHLLAEDYKTAVALKILRK
jgi:hypothetical protein